MIKYMEKTFTRVRSVKDITIFSSLIILGSVLIALPTGAAINITGFFLIFAGLILMFVLRSGYKEEGSNERYQKEEHFFQQAMNAAIASVLESKPESIDLREADKGNAVRLDVYYRERLIFSFSNMFHTNMSHVPIWSNMILPELNSL